MCLSPEVVEIQLVDQAPHTPQDVATRRPGVVAVADADDADPVMLEAADDGLLLDLVAGKSIQGFDDQDLEAVSLEIREEPQAAGSPGDRNRTADPVVTVRRDDGEPVTGRPRTADPQRVRQ